MIPTDDDDITEWVRRRLLALDTTPRNKMWRRNALGVSRTVALASAPKWGHITFPIPPAEMSILRRCAEARGTSVQGYARAAVGTALVALDDIGRDALPMLGADLLGPR